jgi:hypothetical protein
LESVRQFDFKRSVSGEIPTHIDLVVPTISAGKSPPDLENRRRDERQITDVVNDTGQQYAWLQRVG